MKVRGSKRYEEKRRSSCIALVFCILSSFVGSKWVVAQEASKPTVRIGLIMPLTGSMAHIGTTFRDAALFALDNTPSNYKFNYELIFEDDALQSAKTATAAQKLLNIDKVNFLISTWSYGGTVVSPLTERAEVPHFGVAWDPTVAQGKFNFIHLTPPNEFLSRFIDAFALLGYRRIAAFGLEESGSMFAMNELQRLVEGTQMRIVAKEISGFNETNFKPALLRALRAQPDILFLNLASPGIDLFVKDLNELKIEIPFTAITGFDVSQNLSALEGKWYVSDSYLGESFTSAFTARYPHSELYGAGNYFDIIKLIQYLCENGTDLFVPTGAALIERMHDLKGFRSLFGVLRASNDGIITYPAQYLSIQGGKRVRIDLKSILSNPSKLPTASPSVNETSGKIGEQPS